MNKYKQLKLFLRIRTNVLGSGILLLVAGCQTHIFVPLDTSQPQSSEESGVEVDVKISYPVTGPERFIPPASPETKVGS
jgi:hypothetical protein